MAATERDLVILVPDKNTEFTIRGGLERPAAIGIRPIDYEILVEAGHDGGVRDRGPSILHLERRRFGHALMVLDYEGCGSTETPPALEAALTNALSATWSADAKAIVVVPEVDIWLWGAETHLKEVFGWTADGGVRDWLRKRGFTLDESDKPHRPKEALQELARVTQTPRSSSNYRNIARRTSLIRCKDASFLRMRGALRQWFGIESDVAT